MNISYQWLRALAPGLDDTPERVAERLAMYGAPVDELLALGEPIADVVIGKVESVKPHPNADRLRVCEVDAGTGELLQVVCGAPNVTAGHFYPFAPVGSSLPGGIKLRKAKIRGLESQGMLCSERELGLGRGHEGIMELPAGFTPGENFVAALGLGDVRIVVDVTPNRPDLLSHLGVARELAPGGEEGLVLPPFPGAAPESAELALERSASEGEAGGVRVVLEDPRGCPRYMGAVVEGVTIAPSPTWLASRLRAIGLRPINNVVDATNYILFELGQPLHAFDLERLGGREVRIRRARAGEKITTLDGAERLLGEAMVVIADAEHPVAVAGVMGGEESEVTAETRAIFLECALFDPQVTRRTRTALGLSTDASYRFERGVDVEGMERAMHRALELIVAVAGGKVVGPGVDLYPEPRHAPVVGLRPARASKLLGVPFTAAEVARHLEPIGFERVGGGEEALRFRVPGHRWHDVSREADLIEEVARRYGYDAFPAELRPFRPGTVPDDVLSALEDRLRSYFVGRGHDEARLSAFTGERGGEVALLNPLSSAEGRLRAQLVPGLLRQVEHNYAHQVRNVRLFEIGTVFAPGEPGEAPREATRIAAVFTGARSPAHWSGAGENYDLWDLKGLAEELADLLGGAFALEPANEPGTPIVSGLSFRAVDSSGAVVGWGGEVDATAIDAPAWADPVYALELVLRREYGAQPPRRVAALPAYPAVERDVALLVADEVPAARVAAAIGTAGGALLEGVEPFDLFRGRGIPADSRSIAYRLRFRAADRTLTDAEVDTALNRILKQLKEELGVERRG